MFSFNCGMFSNFLILNMASSDKTERMVEISEQIDGIMNFAKAEKRDLTQEEAKKIDTLFLEFEALEKSSTIEDKLSQTQGRRTSPNEIRDGISRPAYGTAGRTMPNGATKGSDGFRDLGEFAITVRHASLDGAQPDRRLIVNAPSSVGSEGVGADGGFSVPPDFRTAIMDKVTGEDSLLGRTDQMVTSGNSIVLPKDETTPWQSTGGIQAYWDGEGDQLTQSKPALQEEILRLNKLTALVPVTEELMEDAPSLDSWLRKKTPEKFDFKINLALVQGTGAGQPTGIINSGCLVSAGKESGQSADTIQFENIVNMWARMYGPCRPKSIWLINQDIEPQLMTMSFEGSSSSVPVYLPAGSGSPGVEATPYSRLCGRPVVPTQACETLGDKGDIILADFSQYLSAVKTGGVRAEMSIHLWFDYDVTAYRFIMRVAGQPWWTAAIDPRDGSNTLSPFVTLDERS